MKKIISAVLFLALMLSLCACGAASAPSGTTAAANAGATGGLQVGFARANITPEDSVPLGGYGNTSTRMSEGMLDYIYTSAIAISDGENTVVIIENDLTAAVSTVLGKVRDKVSEKAGIPRENIMAAVDHVHSAPDLWNTGEASIAKYSSKLITTMTENALAAVEDMKPVTVTSGSAETQDLNFVRHYVLEDGHVRGPSFGLQYNSPKVGYTHEPDRQLQVISFQQEGGKEILLVNFQAHPQRATDGNYNSVTADTIGAMRDHVMSKKDCEVFYVLGASGDLMSVSLISEDNVYQDYKSHGKALGEAVLGVVNGEMAPLETGSVKTLTKVYTGTVDKTENNKVAEAREIVEHWTKHNDYNAAVAMGESCGINSPYHAQGILNKSDMDDTEDFSVYAFGIGELGFVFAPYEMFCENGSYIKENSPFGRTIVCTMANSSFNYIPAAAGFDYNCYEANTCRFIKGTGEELAELFVSMLADLKG